MTRTHEDVGDLPEGKREEDETSYTPMTAALAVQDALKIIDGRWKLEILFCLFGGQVRRFSELERAIEGV